MKKFVFVLLVLAIALPAMAANDVVLSFRKTPEVNAVILAYKINNLPREARAFALNIGVSDKDYVVGSVQSMSNDYYIHPTNITFDVNASGVTYIKSYGSPATAEDANGFILEMASLYAAADVNHPAAPPSSGDLVKFFVKNNCPNPDAKVTFTVSQNTQRGGIVLKDPNVTPTVTLPASSFYIPSIDCGCMVVNVPTTKCGGVLITQARYNNWVQIGKPQSWCHPGHYAGDCTLDCSVTAGDASGPAPPNNPPNFVVSFGKAWPNAAYQPACDVNMDKSITAADITGSGVPGGGLKPNFGKVIPSCPICP